MTSAARDPRYAICVRNQECEDLEMRKLYQVLPDPIAARDGYIRIIDESGEDYLYPESYFVLVRLPLKAQQAIAATA